MRLRLATGRNLAFSPANLLAILILLAVCAAAQPSLGQVGDPVTNTVADDSANPVTYDANAEWGDFLFRFQYHTRGYGEEAGLGALGINRFWLFDRVVLFADGSARIDDDRLRPPTPSVGGGLRMLYQNWLGGDSERIFGANFWYDGTHTTGLDPTDNYYYFQQFSVGLESLGEKWDFRVNANLPVGNTVYTGQSTITTVFDEHYLDAEISRFKRYAVRTVEAEAARRIGDRNLWAFASCYGLDGGGEQAVGGKVGLRGYLARDVLASLSVANDGMFDTTVMFNITWFLDWGAHGRAEMAPACLTDRLREPVQRNDYVAVVTKQDITTEPVTDASGTPLYFVHVDSNAAVGGNGTFEHPFSTLALAQANSSVGNYLYLHGNSVFTAQSITLQNAQSLFGEGVSGGHAINAYLSGQPTLITLPDGGGAIPEIFNAPGASAVQLANNNTVWGLTIDTAVNGITAPSGTTNATINHVTAQNTAGAGLNFQATSGSVTVGQYTYAGGSGTGVNIQNSTATFAFTDTSVTSSGTADAVSLTGNAGAAIAFNGLNVSTTTGRGFVASGGGTIAVTGSGNTIATGAATGAGLDLNGVAVGSGGMSFASVTTNGAAHGVSLVNVSGGAIAVTGGTISNSTGAAVVVNGGTPNATIDASIPNGADYAVEVENLSSSSSVAFGGNITNTAKGLAVKNNAGGNVSFTGALSLTTGASDAVELTGNTATAISFNCPSMVVTTTSGQGFVASGGTVTVTGGNNTIATTTGVGLSLGTVTVGSSGMNFASVNTTGAAHGISLDTVSGGPLTVAGGTISGSTGAAVVITGGTPNATINAAIAGNTLDHSVDIQGISGGSVTFGGSIADDGMGIQVTGNSGGSVSFTGPLALHTTTNNAVDLTGNTATSISFNSSSMDIQTTSGQGFAASGGTVTVTGGSNTIATATGVGLSLGTVTVGSGGMNFASVNTTGAAHGISLDTVSGGPLTVAGGTISGSTGAAIVITGGTPNATINAAIAGNTLDHSVDIQGISGGSVTFGGSIADDGMGIQVTGNSGGNVSFTGPLALHTTTNNAVDLTGNTATSISFNSSSMDIQTTSGQGLVASGGTVTVTGGSNTIATGAVASGAGLSLNNVVVGSDGMNFAGLTVAAGAASGVSLTNVTGGSITITGGSITDTTGVAFNVTGGTVDVAFTGQISQTVNNVAAVSVSGGHTGDITFTATTSGDSSVVTTAGTGLQFNNASGKYQFDQISINGGSAAIGVTDSTGTFLFTAGTIAGTTGAAAVTIDGGAPTVNVSANITNTTGHSAVVQNLTGGGSNPILFYDTITDSGSGVLIQNNNGGLIGFAATTLNTTTNNAITVTGNTATSVTFNATTAINTTSGNAVAVTGNSATSVAFGGSGGNSLAITTTTGTGFLASGGGTLSVSGSSNTIATTTGAGLNLSDMTIDTTNGMNFASVSTGAAANGILLNNVTGGSITINGGTLSGTTGNAVSATNVANLSLNNMTITAAGGDGVYVSQNNANASVVTVNACTVSDSTTHGIELAAGGAATTTLNLTGNSVTGSTNIDAVYLNVASSSANTVFMIVTGNTVSTADGSALALNLSGTAGTVTTLFSNNAFNNSSATTVTADVENTETLTLNGTFATETFNNAGTGDNFQVRTNAGGAVAALNLTGNTATGGTAQYNLTNTAGTFTVYPDKTTMEGNNTGTFNYSGTIDSNSSPPPTP